MIQRDLDSIALKLFQQFPILAVIGPRQAGKTTLVKSSFPELPYVSLEDLDNRQFAQDDPRGFLSHYKDGAIIDEAQRVPDLFSYLQTEVDKSNKPGQYILTGSHNFLLMEKITQSLAGRVALLKLLPLSLTELKNNKMHGKPLNDYLHQGFYPILHDREIDTRTWYDNYIQTYLEKDVRQLKNVNDLSRFQLFIKMCANRVGQIVNLSSLADDCGITHNTAKDWISVLEASFIVFQLRPHYKNFNKRLIKSPKLYFYDIGIVSHLLNIRNPKALVAHSLRGELVENLIIADLMKSQLNTNINPELYFWRDKTGHEIDCVIEDGETLKTIEIKSGMTINSNYFKNLRFIRKLAEEQKQNLKQYLIYGGDEAQTRNNIIVLSWMQAAEALTLPTL